MYLFEKEPTLPSGFYTLLSFWVFSFFPSPAFSFFPPLEAGMIEGRQLDWRIS